MTILQNKILFFSFFILSCFVFPAGLLAQNATKTVAILPFQLNAPPDQQYLSEGLRDMLSSRLRTEAGASVVAKNVVQSAVQNIGGQPTVEQLDGLAKQVSADYLIYGTITALGGGISIDTKVFTAGAAPESEIQGYYSSATTNDRIMSAIDSLSWDILETKFGKQRPVPVATVQAPATATNAAPSMTTAHPDKLFMSGGSGNIRLRSGRDFVKSRNFDMTLRGFDIGDVDGDGIPEVILASGSKVKVFRRDGTRLNLLATIDMLVRYPVHAVNTADLNGNGRAEIYISASDAKGPSSSAVEWNGEGFADLFTGAKWYIRPLQVPERGLVLAGQTNGVLALEPGIFVLGNVDGKLQVQEKLAIPKEINLFDFSYANLDGSGNYEIVALDSSFKLRVIQNGTTVWKSDERFGGTKRFVGGKPSMGVPSNPFLNDEVDAVGEKYKRFYLPSRILVTDVDSDGKDDIIVNQNPESISTVAQNLIQYPNGTLVGMKWNGIGLEELWRTQKIGGYVVDYQVKSLVLPPDKVDNNELFIGIVLESGPLNPLSSDQATVVIYPFEIEKPET